jgi:hypothetical protein
MIAFFSISTTDIEESKFYFQEFTTRVHGIGFLGEQLSKELTEFLQYLISLRTDSIQEAAHASTLQGQRFEQRVLHFFQIGLGAKDRSQFQFGAACLSYG